MSRSGITFVGVGAVVLALGLGLWAGKSSRAREAEQLARATEEARRRAAADARAAAAARRSSTLQRIHIAAHSSGLFQGISVCPSIELTNCELRLGIRDGTVRWTTPRVLVPERCENLPIVATADCIVRAQRADAASDPSTIDTNWACRMERGFFGSNVNAFRVVDLREPQLENRAVVLQCNEGRYEGTMPD